MKSISQISQIELAAYVHAHLRRDGIDVVLSGGSAVTFYFWHDRQALEQALLVFRQNSVDLAEIERWSLVEGQTSGWNVFEQRLRPAE